MVQNDDGSEDAPNQSPHGPTPSEQFDPEQTRDMCFDVLASRIGEDAAMEMRQDFDNHVQNDSVEQAYVCLFGKMVNAIDRAMSLIVHGELPEDSQPVADDAAIAGFKSFR